MTEVEKGGATAFPYLTLKLPVVKGSAAFWYNLHTSGAGDYATWHSGCPVLVGSKFVATIWLHQFGQEWRRPCGLEYTHTDRKQIEHFLYLFENNFIA